jgi:heat shock protein HslJ
MKKLTSILALSLALTGCQTTSSTPTAPDNSTRYKALGTEPFWSLNVGDGKMVFDHSGEVTATASQFTKLSTIRGFHLVSKEITAEIIFDECSDGMSEYSYKDTVKVVVGDAKYQGCGGGILPPSKLDKTSWRVVSITGENIARERGAQMTFDEQRISGSIGCNQMSGSYRYTDNQLSVLPLISTRKGCPDLIDAQETKLAAILTTIAITDFPGDGTMVLTGKDGAKVVLAQLM